MTRLGLAALLFCASCGRLGFASEGGNAGDDAGPGSDGAPGDAAVFSPGFPRLAAMSASNSQAYDDPVFRQRAAAKSFVIISYYDQWENGRSMTLEQVVSDIHARSTIGTKIFAYINDFDELPDPDNGDARMVPLYNKLTAEKWWLYANGNTGTPVRVTGNNAFGLINYSSNAPADSDGNHYADINAKYHVDFTVTGDANNHPTPSLDGFYVANLTTRVVIPAGDWNRDGTTDAAPGTQAIKDSLREGGAAYFTAMHALAPDLLVLAGQFAWDDDAGALDQVYAGGTRNVIIGAEGSGFENLNGFAAMMAEYKRSLAVSAAPKLVLFTQGSWTAGDYKSMRYGLCSALMDDGYYDINDGVDSLVNHGLDFDEFTAELGAEMQPPQNAAWQNGVWRRDFEGGIALVNPRGNGPQTVQLMGSFHRLTGQQDPVANSGATVTSVTLADRDGLILLR